MALKPMDMKPETRPDPRFATTYQASRGGHYPKPETPTTKTPKNNT